MTPDERKYWHGRTWRIAAPVILTNVSVPVLGIVDTAVVGRLPGPEYVGAVAIGALVFNLLYHGCNFLRMGTTGLTAQSHGARDGREVRTWLARALLLAAVIGITMIVLQWPLFEVAALVVGPSAAVEPLSRDYFAVRIWAAPFALANLALLGWFFGVQNTRAALITQVYMNGINALLSIWFVHGLGWGVTGVAWATVVGETTAVALGFVFAAGHLRRMGGRFRPRDLLDAVPLKRMLAVNRDIFLRSLLLQGAFVTMTSVGARMGDATLAANAVLLHFQTFSAHAMDGFSTAAEALVGEAYGRRSRRRFKAAVRAASGWAVGFAVLFGLFYALAGSAIVDLMTTVETVRETAYAFLPYMVALPLISVWSFLLDGIFIGCTWSREMRNGMVVSVLVFLAALAVLVPAFGNHGLWTAFSIFMVARAATLGWVLPALQRRIPSTP